MDREGVMRVFKEYTDDYDVTDPKISLKIRHTYRVADIAEKIALSIGLKDKEVELAWFNGMLHDIGRFEQLRRYDTFVDRDSVDHAMLGADILFKDGLIESFPTEGLPDGWEQFAETAVRCHSWLNLPEDMDKATRMYTDILRDADKCDIFRVLTEPPHDVRNANIIASDTPACDMVMQGVREHRCVPRTFQRTEFEALMMQCCMAFELVYQKSRDITKEQGYLDKLMDLGVKNEEMKEQQRILREEMKKAMDSASS